MVCGCSEEWDVRREMDEGWQEGGRRRGRRIRDENQKREMRRLESMRPFNGCSVRVRACRELCGEDILRSSISGGLKVWRVDIDIGVGVGSIHLCVESFYTVRTSQVYSIQQQLQRQQWHAILTEQSMRSGHGGLHINRFLGQRRAIATNQAHTATNTHTTSITTINNTVKVWWGKIVQICDSIWAR